MSNSRSIYILRKQIDPDRQPSTRPRLAPLWESIERLGADTPYDLTDDQLSDLLAEREFTTCGMGRHANSSATYLYRLTSIAALVRSVTKWTARIRAEASDQSLFRLLDNDYRRTGGWLSLSAYATGNLRGFRGISWWAHHDFSGPRTIEAAYKCGLPNDWIPVNAVVLRCRVKNLKMPESLRVPEGVDAFFSEIFQAVHEDAPLAAGEAIDLTDPTRLVVGEKEFVIGSIPVGAVELKPLNLRDGRRNGIDLERLRPALEAFYHSLK